VSVDLEALRRSDASPAARRGGGRFVVAVLVLGVLGWAFLLMKDRFFPARVVSTAAVRVETGAAARAASVEATGWIEPDPFPITVRPLVDGVVESIDVVEGSPVVAGVTAIARLRNVDLEAEAETKALMAAHVERHLGEARAERDEAKALLEQKLDVRREVARLEGEAARAEGEAGVARADVAVARAALEGARTEAEAEEAVLRAGGGSSVARARARSAFDGAEAGVQAKEAALARATAALAATNAELAVAKEAVAFPRALEGALAKATAHVAAGEAELATARAEAAVAKRKAELLVVVAPASGVVLRRGAQPGSSVGPTMSPVVPGAGRPDEAMGALVLLYDPRRLQARVDVPYASVGAIGAGAKAELSADAVPGRRFAGTVVRLQSEADPAKGTLQVKVRIDDPDPILKPEMLVRTRFLVEAKPGAEGGGTRVLVPKAAVRGGAIFVVDPRSGGRARRVAVHAMAAEGDWVEVHGDVSATHRVILDEGVSDGDRIREATP
jgi:HlyD family secretion protein